MTAKCAVITGASRGIGAAAAEKFAGEGWNLCLTCIRSGERLEHLARRLHGEFGITCLPFTGDMGNEKDVEKCFRLVQERFGRLDALVNNAGINIPRLLVDDAKPHGEFELDDAVFDKVVNVNLKGVYLCAQAAGRVMVGKKDGVIINMSSESGLEGSEGQSIYAATKNAVNSFTRSWAKELGRKGVRVVGVAPGIMEATGLRTIGYETALAYTRGITVEELRAGYSKTSTTPMGRSGRLSEVADMVCYLGSEKASYVHGVTYNVAGGKTRG